MERIKLTLMYDGTQFHGWQVQPGADTVQSRLCTALSALSGCDVAVTGSSRTDAGVHALGYVCHFDNITKIPPEKLPAAINAHLPAEISVMTAEAVESDFHSRYDSKGKTYRYLIHNSRERNPFYINRAEHCHIPLDLDKMRNEAKSFVGEHDFSAFMATGSKIEDCMRTIYSATLEKNSDIICFEVCGNGFLYNMVRIMAGTLIDIGRGQLNMPVSEILSSCKRNNAGYTAPACGLYLKEVLY